MFVFAASIWGQTQANTGEIGGRVLDRSGMGVQGAKVVLRNVDTNLLRELEAGTGGIYRVPLLPIGEYEISIQAAGFGLYRLVGLSLSTGQTLNLDHVVDISTTYQGVDVKGESPLVEVSQSSTSRVVSELEVKYLPNLARNELQFALLQPFINGNRPREYEAPRFDIGGLARRVEFQIDGFENTTSQQKTFRVTRLTNVAVEETQILTFGANAEYGRTAGGVINNITRAGTNAFHGQVEYLFSRPVWNADPYRSSGAVKPSADIGAFGVGGPLKRDRLFFFLSNESSARAFPLPLGFTSDEARQAAQQLKFSARDTDLLPSRFNPKLWLTRIDYNPTMRHSISIRGNTYREFNDAQGPGGTTILSSSYGALTNTYSTGVGWTWLISPNLIHETRFQFADRYTRRTAISDKATEQPLPATVLSGYATFGATNGINGSRERLMEFSDNLSWTVGRHVVKTGLNLVHSPLFYETATNPVFVFSGLDGVTPVEQYLATRARETDPETGRPYTYSQLLLSFGKPRIDYSQTYLGSYIQDSWRVRPNLTLNFGLRYETSYVPQPRLDTPNPLSRQFPSGLLNLAPRFGLAWSPGRGGKTVVRMSYGWHYDAPQSNAYRDVLINNAVNEVSVQLEGGAPGSPQYPFYPRTLNGLRRAKPSLNVVDPNFAWMYAQQFQFGLAREIFHNWKVAVTYAFLRGTHIPVQQNINLKPESALLGDGRPIYATQRLDGDFNNIMSLGSGGNSNYNALGVNVSKRWRNGLHLNASYTWSHALDNAPEAGIAGGSEQPQDTYNRRAEYGNSITDMRHVLNLSGIYRWRKYQIATFLYTRSGTTYDVRAGADLNKDGVANDRPLFYGRNLGKGPASSQVDVRVSRFWGLEKWWAGARMEGFGESANVLNSPIPDSTNAFLNRTNFYVLSWHEMRRLQFGLRLWF